MRLLVDSDAFTKLGAAGLFPQALDCLDIEPQQVRLLPSMRHMLRRGSLRRKYGVEVCDRLIAMLDCFEPLRDRVPEALDALVQDADIDPGEGLLLSVAAETDDIVLTGDKRAVLAASKHRAVSIRLNGRIIIMEALLLSLCGRFGSEHVRACVTPVLEHDAMLRVCFSPSNPNPQEALYSYCEDLGSQIGALALWTGSSGNG